MIWHYSKTFFPPMYRLCIYLCGQRFSPQDNNCNTTGDKDYYTWYKWWENGLLFIATNFISNFIIILLYFMIKIISRQKQVLFPFLQHGSKNTSRLYSGYKHGLSRRNSGRSNHNQLNVVDTNTDWVETKTIHWQSESGFKMKYQSHQGKFSIICFSLGPVNGVNVAFKSKYLHVFVV